MRILVVEDDRDLVLAVGYRLRKEGFEVTACSNGVSGLEALAERPFDLIILDRMMPEMDGDTMLKKLRSSRDITPVLMLTAMDGIRDRVAGLDAGADDYLVKPFAMDELTARIRALSRRKAPWNPSDIIGVEDLTLDTQRLTLSCGDRQATLSRREGGLLELLLRNHGQVLPRAVILDRVWSDTIVEEGNLDIYVHFVRKHLTAVRSRCAIHTVRGVGYRLDG